MLSECVDLTRLAQQCNINSLPSSANVQHAGSLPLVRIQNATRAPCIIAAKVRFPAAGWKSQVCASIPHLHNGRRENEAFVVNSNVMFGRESNESVARC